MPNPTYLDPVRPVHARRGEFTPEVGGFLTVTLPGEMVRSEVIETFGRDVVMVKILGVVLGKGGATQKTGDLVAVRRSQKNELTEEWIPVSDREVAEQEQRERAMKASGKSGPDAARAEPEAAPLAPVGTEIGTPAPALMDVPVGEGDHRRVLGPRRSHISRSA
jgi:hypothetical protein